MISLQEEKNGVEPKPETIGVLVSFSGRKIQPVAFRWGQKRYRVDRLNLTYRRRNGKHLFYHFTVTAGADVFDLCFDPETLDWALWRGP